MHQPGFLAACFVTLSVATGAVGEPEQGGSMDPSGVATDLDLTERGVRKWLVRLGATGDAVPAERLLAVTLTGEPLLERDGGGSSVQVDPELDRLLRRLDRPVVLVHNHPSNGGLSQADIGQLAKAAVAAIVAVGHDGSVFLASAGPCLDGDRLEERQYARARDEVRKGLRAEWASRRVSVAVSDVHFSHLVTLALAKAGIVRYWFTLRGSGRESFEQARRVFGEVVVGAAAWLKKSNVRGTGRPAATCR